MSNIVDPTWEITMRDTNDPHGHTVRAVQREPNRWAVTYYRGDGVISTGTIITPPPHQPPIASLMVTLRSDRLAADHE